MTSLIKGFVGTLSDALDINQATLSGCIDIIIVEHDDGSRHSTPFHVRFGKLQLLRSREKLVTIYVNGEKTPLTMKLGRAGEAYFYEQFETDTDGEWSASPMHSPIHSPVASPEKYSAYNDEIIVRDIIEELITSVENSFADSLLQRADPETFVLNPENDRDFPLVPIDQSQNALLSSGPENSTHDDLGDIPLSVFRGSTENDLLGSPPPLDLGSTTEVNKKPARRSADKLWSVWSWGWGSLPVRQLATSSSDRYDDDLLDPVYMESPITSSSSSVLATITAPEHTGRSLSWVSSIIGIFRGKSDANTLIASEPPFVDVRLFVTRRGHVRIQIQPRNIQSPSSSLTEKEDFVESADLEPSSTPNGIQIVTPSSVAIPVSHSVELSLCAHLLNSFDDNATKLMRFRENIITFERLCSDPSIIYDSNLMVRYQDLFYPGKVALPLIVSYLAFGRPLTPEALSKFHITTQICLSDSQCSAAASSDAAKSSFLYRWFGQDGSGTVKATSLAQSKNRVGVSNDPGQESSQVFLDASSTVNSDSPEIRPVNIPSPKSTSHKTLRPTSDMLRLLNLNFGKNVISFCVESALQGMQVVEGFIYLWPESAKIVISDVDGTITRSDLLGNIMPLMGKDWSQVGVTSFFSNIAANGYNMLYLTSRAIGQANVTRTYLSSIKQGAISLPQGPVIMSPDSLISSFKREVIYRRPQEFKIPALRDVGNLFPEGVCPFVAGFGNRDTDIESYIAVGIPLSMIFIIDPKGSIHRMKSVHRTSYSILNDQVEHMFPPFNKRASRAHSSFSEFHYWRQPIRALKDLHLDKQQKQTDLTEAADNKDQLRVQISPAHGSPQEKIVIEIPNNGR